MQLFRDNGHIGLLILRLFIGLRLLYGVIDNVLSWDRMIEFSAFIASVNLPFPLFSAVVSVYAQFFASLMILSGYKIRWACLVMIINFMVAIYSHIQLQDSIEGMTAPMAMLFGCATLLFSGAGKWRVGAD